MVSDGEYAKMWIADEILYFVYKPINIIDIKRAKVIVKQRLEIQNEVSYPVFCDLRAVNNADKDAREYLSTQGSLMIKAVAVLVRDEHAKAILDMYLRTTNKNSPTQVFFEKDAALNFLETYK